jgi:hypothetical protein
MTYFFEKAAFSEGVLAAHAKLGTAPGPIEYAPTGQYDPGGADAMQHSPIRNQYLTDAIHQAFVANEGMDASYGPESAMTQPMGSTKAAASIGGMGSMGSAGPMTTMGMGAGLKGSGSMRSARGMMGLNSVPKPPQSAAMQSLKTPMPGNMQQQLSAGSMAADAANSFGFNHRRITGNPL